MLEEIKFIDRIEVIRDKSIVEVVLTQVIKDKECIAQTVHRELYTPDTPLDKLDGDAKKIAKVIWTQKVMNEYYKNLEQDIKQKAK